MSELLRRIVEAPYIPEPGFLHKEDDAEVNDNVAMIAAIDRAIEILEQRRSSKSASP